MADGGWRNPKEEEKKSRKRAAPRSYVVGSLSDLNWWPVEEPDSPPIRRVWPIGDPILPGRYGNLIESPPPAVSDVPSTKDTVRACRSLFPGSNWDVAHRPVVTMKRSRSGDPAGGDDTPPESFVAPSTIPKVVPESPLGDETQLFPGTNWGLGRRPVVTMKLCRSDNPADGDETPPSELRCPFHFQFCSRVPIA